MSAPPPPYTPYQPQVPNYGASNQAGYAPVPAGGYQPQYQPYQYQAPPPQQQTNVVVVSQPTAVSYLSYAVT